MRRSVRQSFLGVLSDFDTIMTFMPKNSAPVGPGASPPGGPRDPLTAVAEAGRAGLVERALWLEALDHTLRQCLPSSLSQHCRLGNVREGTLVFLVGSPVWKAKLRLHADLLLERARAAGLPARELLVKVATVQSVSPDRTPPPPLTQAARDALREAAESVADPEIRARLRNMASAP